MITLGVVRDGEDSSSRLKGKRRHYPRCDSSEEWYGELDSAEMSLSSQLSPPPYSKYNGARQQNYGVERVRIENVKQRKSGIGQISIMRWKNGGCGKGDKKIGGCGNSDKEIGHRGKGAIGGSGKGGVKIGTRGKRIRSERDLADIINIDKDVKKSIVGNMKWKGSDRLPVVLIVKKSNGNIDAKGNNHSDERLRFPRKVGMPFSECEKVLGWKAFESFTCKEGTLKGVCYRLTVVRQYFKFAQDNGRTVSFELFFDSELTEKFVSMIIGDEFAKAKTKINKLWALRFAFGWLETYSGLGVSELSGSGNIGILRYLSVLVSSKVSQLHQQAKADAGIEIEKEVMVARNRFLSKEQFKSLAIQLINQLFLLERELCEPCHEIDALIAKFRKCLFTSFFVVIPVQRLRVIFDLRWKDIALFEIGDGGSIQVGVEKTSFAKLGRGETIGRAVFIPEVLARFVRFWKVVTPYKEDNDYLFGNNGKYMVSSEASQIVISVMKKLTGKHISAQTLRKLRITHVLNSIHDEMDFNRVLESMAKECGNSAEIIQSAYWVRDSRQRVSESRKTVENENAILFSE